MTTEVFDTLVEHFLNPENGTAEQRAALFGLLAMGGVGDDLVGKLIAATPAGQVMELRDLLHLHKVEMFQRNAVDGGLRAIEERLHQLGSGGPTKS